MKTLQERFQENKEEKPGWSDYLCFANAINRRDSFYDIKTVFKQVDKSDYDREDKDEILQYLYQAMANA